jgi:hypothetical protein
LAIPREDQGSQIPDKGLKEIWTAEMRTMVNGDEDDRRVTKR